jgi:putative ABC transport system ATP-binding protein
MTVADVRPLVKLESLRKSYFTEGGELPILKGISLEIHSGEFVALTGPSGSGKSTLLALLGCLDRPTGGRYEFDGVDASNLNDDAESQLRNASIGFIFQAFHLINSLTLVENVEMPLFYAGVTRRQRRTLAEQALERVGLADRVRHRPNQLSGGEQQRTAIARALVRDPPFIVADEPTGNLDTRTGEKIMAIFNDLHAAGKTLLLVTHDPVIAAQAPREIRLRDGVLCEDVRRSTEATIARD